MGLFGRKKKAITTPDYTDWALPIDVQIAVATEQALLASLEAIIFQKEAWNELVERLHQMGACVTISPEESLRYEAIMKRLSASLLVVAQESSIASELSTRLEEMND